MYVIIYTGVPSVNKSTFTLSSVYSRDQFLKEFQALVTHVSSDVQPKVFKAFYSDDSVCSHVIQYTPCRQHLLVSFHRHKVLYYIVCIFL